MLELLKIGDKLEISLYPEQDNAAVHLSKLDDVLLDESCVVIYMPISHGQFVKLSQESRYLLSFFSSIDGKTLRFKARVLRYLRKEGFNFIVFKLLDSGERIQRRQFFRFACVTPFKFSKVEELDTEENFIDSDGVNIQIYYDGILRDIGGGGIKFVSNEPLEEGEYILCTLNIGSENIDITGVIIHKQSFPKSAYRFQYRLKFEDISNAHRDKIVQFVFNEQRRTVKKLVYS